MDPKTKRRLTLIGLIISGTIVIMTTPTLGMFLIGGSVLMKMR